MEQKNIFDTLLETLKKSISILPDKSEENPDNTLRSLWLLAKGIRMSPIVAEKTELPQLNTEQIDKLEEYVRARLNGTPLAHLTERQNFMGLDYLLNKGLYIPRKETELLAKTAIATIASDFNNQHETNVIDLCCGIGTVALAIAHYCTNTLVYGSDIYLPAIDAAHNNAQHFKLNERALFFHADMFEPFESISLTQNTDIIVSAPPYISSGKVGQMNSEIADHEPREAFDAGPFGLSIFNKLISISPEYLRINGYLIFECGLGQADFLASRIRINKHYGEVSLINDENGNARVVKAKRTS